MKFTRYVGIDYSGAATPETRLQGLQIFQATQSRGPRKVSPIAKGAKNWNRRDVADYCAGVLKDHTQVIIGIDHGFSFPMSCMKGYSAKTWNEFLEAFHDRWRTADPGSRVKRCIEEVPCAGNASDFRLCERWTAGAKSVFQFGVPGSVATSTHAGIPWLRSLRMGNTAARRAHFWPFDGFAVPEGKSVVAEVYPALFKSRYQRGERTADEHDAYSVAAWLRAMDHRGHLSSFFSPPLIGEERRKARLEGWILGVW